MMETLKNLIEMSSIVKIEIPAIYRLVQRDVCNFLRAAHLVQFEIM